MKKYILAVVIAISISIHSKAQESKSMNQTTVNEVSEYDTKASSDVKDIKSYVKMTPNLEQNLHGLFRAKHKMLFNAKDESAKTSIKEGIEIKLTSAIGRENIAKIKSNPVLFEKLMN